MTMIQKLQQVNGVVRAQNRGLGEEEIMKKVWEEYDKIIEAMQKELDDFKTEINDPEERKKVEQAISQGT